MIVLDLECGMGGWSIGFYREGFDCVGIDIVDVGYPYWFLQADIHNVRGEDLVKFFGPITAVVASPPCIEFSQITKLSAFKGQRPPPDPEKGMELVRETKRVIDEIKPRYWVLENVFGARKYIDEFLGRPTIQQRPWCLWGKWPSRLFSFEPQRSSKSFHHGPWNWSDNQKGFHAGKDPSSGKYVIGKNFSQLNDWKKGKGGTRRGLPEDFPFDPLRSWKRARIPVWLGQSIAQSIRQEVEQETHGKPTTTDC